MNLDELEKESWKYDNTNYADFLLDYAGEILELNPENQFILFKDLYIKAKFGDSSAANLIQEHVEEFGVPPIELNNIRNNVKFDDKGEVRVYRGLDHRNDIKGSSYTLNKEKAIWFSTRLKADNTDVRLIELKVTIEDIIFYSNGRNEKEVFLKNSALNRI
ncbi:hypothetical protein [Clostridium beijerinckii]|uniref:Uncharacterized protein n=1 Tax=Clostridium beijerinckii TaxID=1520 RepID=A0AAX0B1A6_CLOBE|nr:hypothetical protein [Clostridium beijerinckii]NRT88737.1 hypothetical protein [Clostridium beijerinckii]NYC74192.1 hypothetical protein [Clostridium beijerinckii]